MKSAGLEYKCVFYPLEFLSFILYNSQKLQDFGFGGVCVLLALFFKP
jgi:hypothetical protein